MWLEWYLELVVLLQLVLAVPTAAYRSGKKSKFLAAYPIVFKFLLFWWCVFVFIVMGVYIIDHLMFRKFGPAKVVWCVEHRFKGGPSGGREAYWAQLADPTTWTMSHPVLQSADIRMVQCSSADKAQPDAQPEAQPEAQPQPGADGAPPETQLRPVPLAPLGAGLGLILRHKEGSGPRSGSFFCTRACEQLEAPAEGPWSMVMRTVEVGAGYPFQAGTEATEVTMHPPAEDGSVRCTMSGSAEVNSRIFRWWNSLEPASRLGAVAMFEAIEAEMLAAKKKD